MYLSHIHLRQYRSYHDRAFDFSPGVTVITGPNGSGKTNILEAIYLLSHGSSFRDTDEVLTEYDQDWWRVSGIVDTHKREIRYQAGKKTFHYENDVRGRFAPAHRLPVVLFEPDDLMLVHGSPSRRRQYIDMVISSTFSTYTSQLRRYERALAQRNRLLKDRQSSSNDSLFVWDITLAEHATVIVRERLKLIDQYNKTLGGYYSIIANRTSTITCTYTRSGENYHQYFLTELARNREEDRLRGFTSIGPHRDDIEFFIDGKSMITTASRGEVRTLLLSLKQYEYMQLEELYQSSPLLLFDDVFSELDRERQQYVTSSFNSQTILTTTDYIHNTKEIHNLSLD